MNRREEIPPPEPQSEPIIIADEVIGPESRERFEMRASRLPTGTWISLPIEVVHGRYPGPVLWLSAAVHGDEINGVEVIRRVLATVQPNMLAGTLIAVPIVNAFGFIEQSRYLPDRRDLNRCFPGSKSGSMASRLAHLFMEEIVSRCTHGIDLHTGSNHRTNLPQIRANLKDERTLGCAEAFAAPMLMHSEIRDGSLRQAASQAGIPMLLFEGGEPLRFDEWSIRIGTEGIFRVMSHLEMWPEECSPPTTPTQEVLSSTWVRARRSGIMRLQVELGQVIHKGTPLALISDAFGEKALTVKAPLTGLVIGIQQNPLVNQGDGIVHIGKLKEDPV